MKIHKHWSKHIKFNGFKLLWIIKFAWFVTLDKITSVKLGANDFLMWTMTLNVIITPCALWSIITYVNTIGVATLALGSWLRQGLAKVRVKSELGVTFHALENARECEGTNPHTPKWTPILGVGVLMHSQIFKGKLQGSKLIGLKTSLYHWKYLGT